MVSVIGRLVRFEALPDDGVPKTGVVSVGEVKVLLVNVCESVVPTMRPLAGKVSPVTALAIPAVRLAAVPVNPVPAPEKFVARTVPTTSNACPGLVEPIPTFA